MPTLRSLSDLKKLKFDEQVKPMPPKQAPDPTASGNFHGAEPAHAPTKRTAREEFAVLLGDMAPQAPMRGIGRKSAPAEKVEAGHVEKPVQHDRKAMSKPPEAPRRPPTVRIGGPAGKRTLAAGSVTVLPPGETTLVVETEGVAPVGIRLVVERPETKVVVRGDAAQAAALARAEKEVSRLAEERDRLVAENETLRAKSKAVVKIDTDELFPGEAYEHVIEALAREAAAAKAADGRRAEVLEAVVKVNPPAVELPRRRRIVDEVLATVRRPGPRELASLAEIGIREVSKNKHYKLGYGKHTQTLALTPSDRRGGQNAAADMKVKFF